MTVLFSIALGIFIVATIFIAAKYSCRIKPPENKPTPKIKSTVQGKMITLNGRQIFVESKKDDIVSKT